MIRKFTLALVLLASINMTHSVKAEPSQPVVYIFGAEECAYCQRAVKFLRTLHTEKGGFVLKEYDIVSSPDDATLFARVVMAIGLKDPVVPMIIVGREVLLGFKSEATTGREIKGHIGRCQKNGCQDVLRPFLELADPVIALLAVRWSVHRRWVEASLRQ
jgi:thiol-disulfide isomerase/thioredoxin